MLPSYHGRKELSNEAMLDAPLSHDREFITAKLCIL
jgi:hypothetical protein